MEPKCGLLAQQIPVFSFLLAVSFASYIGNAQAQEATIEAIKARIEGIYVLEEWRRNGEVAHPPLVDGRTVLLNGRIMYISHYRANEANKRTTAGLALNP